MNKKELLKVNEYLESMDILIDSSKQEPSLLLAQQTFDLLKSLYLKVLKEPLKIIDLKIQQKIKSITLIYNKKKLDALELMIKKLTDNSKNKTNSELNKKISLLSEELHEFYDKTNLIIKLLSPHFDLQIALKKALAFLKNVLNTINKNKLYKRITITCITLLAAITLGNSVYSLVVSHQTYKLYPATLSDNIYGIGWYTANKQTGLRWSCQKDCFISIPGQKTNSDRELKLFVEESINTILGIEQQRVEVYVNNTQLSDLLITGKGIYSVKIPQEIISTQNLKIKLTFLDTVPSHKIFKDNGSHPIGINLKGIGIDEVNGAPYYKLGKKLTFGQRGTALKYLTQGWSVAEANSHNILNGSADLSLKLSSINHDLKATIELAKPLGIGTEPSEQKMNVYINRTLVHTEKIYDALKISFKIPKTLLNSKVLHVNIQCSSNLGEWEGNQKIALMVKSLQIR